MILASRSERRQIARDAIILHPHWSDRRIAETMPGVSRDMLAAVRQELVANGTIKARKRVIARDGKRHPIVKSGGRSTGLANKTRAIQQLTATLSEAMYERSSRKTQADFDSAVATLVDRLGDLKWWKFLE